MSRKSKRNRAAPDDFFVHGPLHAARFGRAVILRSEWPTEAYSEMQQLLAARHPAIVAEIDALVTSISAKVSQLPPAKLLQHAWWEMASRAHRIECEADIGREDGVAMRMLDYVQSIIASVKPAPNQGTTVSEAEWNELRAQVAKLFDVLNLEYQVARTAKARSDNPNFDDGLEEFYFKAQIYWCNVRGTRFQNHQIIHLRDILQPHSAAFQKLFGISAGQFIDELGKIWHALTFGLAEITEEMELFRRDTLDALDAKLDAGLDEAPNAEPDAAPPDLDKTLSDLMQAIIRENGWEERKQRLAGRFFDTDLYDLQKLTLLPQPLLDALSWGPGEDQEFFSPGEFKGWPLRIWPTFKRPFIRLDGRYYCFDLYGLFDNLYRVVQRLILSLDASYRETWKDIQQEVSESLPLRYLTQILPGSTTFRSVHYPYTDPKTMRRNWCEADSLLLYDDHLFIIEARGGAFTYTAPATDFPAFIESLKNLVLKPATQGQRFLDYLSSSSTVPIFDESHEKTGELSRSAFRHITICPVTLDPFNELTAQVQHLRKVGVDVGTHPVWAISLDDLRVYSDIFDHPLHFLHYTEQRMRAFASTTVQSDDELDHLGLYLRHNNYSIHAENLKGSSDAKISFTGYRSDIDRFFHERLNNPATPCPLKQKTPPRVLEIISVLSASRRSGRSKVSGFLLDLDGHTRRLMSDHIDLDLSSQPMARRPKPFSTHGQSPFTVFCYLRSVTRRDPTLALDHARSLLLMNQDRCRLLLELGYTAQGTLIDVFWDWVDGATIPQQDLPRLNQRAAMLRRTRIANEKRLRGKIPRNEQCPCGSGKKYKRCCIARADS